MSPEATQTVKTVNAYDLLAWLETNKKALVIAFVAAVVIGFGIAIYRYKVDQRELEASDALLELKTSLSATNQVPPADYLKVAQQYPGTAAADRALLLAGGALFTEGKYAEAQAEFARFQQDRPQSPFAATAAYGIAACLEAEGQQDKALVAYQNLSVRYPNSSVVDDSKLAVARIYVAQNKPEQALRIYDELTKPTAMTAASSQAMQWKQELLASHPELAKTNAPAAPATTNATAPANETTSLTVTTNSATANASTTVVAPPSKAQPAPASTSAPPVAPPSKPQPAQTPKAPNPAPANAAPAKK